jgi:hypothetical protein
MIEGFDEKVVENISALDIFFMSYLPAFCLCCKKYKPIKETHEKVIKALDIENLYLALIEK